MKKAVLFVLAIVFIFSLSACETTNTPAADSLESQIDDGDAYQQGYNDGYAVGFEAGKSEAASEMSESDGQTSSKSDTSSEPETQTIGTRKCPATINEPVTCELRDCIMEVTLLEVIRGEESISIAKEANSYNEYDDDVDLILAKFKIKHIEDLSGEDESYLAYVGNFEYADSTCAKEFSAATVASFDDMHVALYEGSEAEGYICFEGKFDQEHDYYVFEDDYWFDVSA